MAGSANISFSSAGTNSVTISYSASGWSLPSGSSNTSTSGNTTTTITTSYSDLKYSWSFSGGNGGSSSVASSSKTITGFYAGGKASLSGTVTVTCTKKTTTKKVTTTTTKVDTGNKDADGNPIYKDETKTDTSESSTTSSYTIGSASDWLSAYTKPSSFSFGATSGAYISDILTATKWNSFVTQLGKYKSWQNQGDYTSSYDYLKVSSGDWITVYLYNQASSACGAGTSVDNNTTISAALINALGNAVS